jgi:sugar phosphate permease
VPIELPRHDVSAATGLKVLWAMVGGIVLAVVLVAWRHFHWQHAFLVGLAGGALVYSALRTVENLRRLR